MSLGGYEAETAGTPWANDLRGDAGIDPEVYLRLGRHAPVFSLPVLHAPCFPSGHTVGGATF